MRQLSFAGASLAEHVLFRGIPPERVSALPFGDASPVSYPRGATIFAPTSFIRALAFVLSGSALVYKVLGDGRRVLMSRLTPGSVFGMASLFSEAAEFPTQIVAEAPVTVLFWSKKHVEAAFQAEPLLARNYIALLSGRIHFLNRRIETFAGEDVKTRLLRLLAGFCGGAETFTLPYSLSQLSTLLGVGRASLYRALDALAAEGILLRHGRHITVQRPDKLPTNH